MAYRTVPSSSVYGRRLPPQAIAPPPTKETFKDLLVFEERLKQNAERLQRQRRKYEAFLITLIIATAALAYKSFLATSQYAYVHYLWVGLFLVCATTLVLFFATGMYSEKISYAYKFIPQTNRALRSLNMYLNTRRPSLRSPFRLFRAPIPGPSPPTSPPPASRSSGHALAPIPPSTNPRGELIFSAKVSPAFRDGYERYRNEWEKRRNTPPPTANVGRGPGRKGWFPWSKSGQTTPTIVSNRPTPSATPEPQILRDRDLRGRDARYGTSSTSASRQSSRRRRGSASSTPSASRSASPSASHGTRSSRASTPELLSGGRSGSSSGLDGEGSGPTSPLDDGVETDFFPASAAPVRVGSGRPAKVSRGDSYSELVALEEDRVL